MTAKESAKSEQPGDKLRVIDISDHQAGIDLSRLDIQGVVIKATEGTLFTNGQYELQYRQATYLGLLRGVYHFARPSLNDAASEAQYFLTAAQESVNDPHTMLVLDYEDTVIDPQWAYDWLSEVQRACGKRPLIYLAESTVNAYDWSKVQSLGTKLWVARYVNDLPYYDWRPNTPPLTPNITWNEDSYVMWQFTSRGWLDGYGGDVDCDWFYGTAADWLAYAAPVAK